MSLTFNKKTGVYRTLGLVGLLLFVNGALSPSLTNAQKSSGNARSAVKAGDTPEELFARGFFYLNNNNVTDKAADEFKLLIRKYPDSADAEKAQFFLGSYYHRKYNILTQRRSGPADSADLYKAKEAYETYMKKYPRGGPCECLADAYFHLSIVLLQLGYPGQASALIIRMRDDVYRIDSKVYIYQVVWSSSSQDVIDSHFDTQRLGGYTYTVSGRDFDTFTRLLKAWCRSEKSRR
jgi:hypothetical protein